MAADVTAGQDLTGVKVTFSVDDPATATPNTNSHCDATTCTYDIPASTTVSIPLTVDIKTASGTIDVTATAVAGTLEDKASFPLTVSDPTNHNGGGTDGGGTDGGGTNGGGTNGGKTGGHTGGTTGGTKGGSTGGTSGGGSNTTGGSTGNVPQSGGLNPPPGTGVTPPSTAPSPGAVLPSIGASPPATAQDPRSVNAGNSQSMRGKAADPDELTFNKLASTQAAWLAALLVAFSLLLTQVRLGKTANRANPVAGVHRRLRRRMRRPPAD